jgi:hypothetical protein
MREQVLFFGPMLLLLAYVIWDVWMVLHFLSYYKQRPDWWKVYPRWDR